MAEQMIKLIWDFHGGEAKKIAEHHEIHLKEFAERENLLAACGVQDLSGSHTIAWMTVPESIMVTVRDALKPHRGELA